MQRLSPSWSGLKSNGWRALGSHEALLPVSWGGRWQWGSHRECLLSGVRSKQASMSPHWLLPEIAYAFAVSVRSSAARENIQGFILLSLISKRRLLYWAELQCCHTKGTCCSLLSCATGTGWVSASAEVINEREGWRDSGHSPINIHFCDTHEREGFCLDALIHPSTSDRRALTYEIHWLVTGWFSSSPAASGPSVF